MKNKANFKIYTPVETVNEMLDLADYHGQASISFLDNSCGNGNILVEAVKRFLKHNINCNLDLPYLLSSQFCGIDIDTNALLECKDRLEKLANSFGLYNIKWNLIKTDALNNDFRGRKFSLIVCNPPYIAYPHLTQIQRKNTKEKFESCKKGKFDYCYAFIELGLSLLNEHGIMVYLTPSNIFKTEFGCTLRTIMQPYICLIRDYSTAKIFDELTSPAVSVFKKETSHELVYQKIGREQIIIDKKSFLGKWIFTKNLEEYKNKKRFGDYFKVSSSIATLSNHIYLINKVHNGLFYVDDSMIESDVVAKAASPKSLKQKKEKHIIFPYYYQNNALCRYKADEFEKKFPQTTKYLLSKRKELDDRDSDKNSEWFEYGRSQALSHLNQPKLLISTLITGKVFTYLLEKDVIPFSGLYIIPKASLSLQKAKEILESKGFFEYINKIGVNASGHTIRISSKDIENYMWGE